MSKRKKRTLDDTIGEIADHAGLLLEQDHTNGSAAVILGLVGIAERQAKMDWEESFSRITALRLALRDVIDLADASVPESVQACRIAMDALDADKASGSPHGAEAPR